jgi:hypothetical protein
VIELPREFDPAGFFSPRKMSAMINKCLHCGFVLPTGREAILKCPKCNSQLPAVPAAQSHAFDSQANTWLEMRRKAGFDER